ncbi:hypothetical protein N9N28_02660 [Rubripirellula amarantea]|uniref:Uncharacterized protein n=1 Tax=Rubripirellula amarantea TaxID=2527999 RepID=A0A5C5WD57_9BACT|nr:hypothetical protein [Rubripirellula amarantea]MDA8743512.1 hypothetical protein [Rubripirellula amarantea]TWT48063.1 hypothetical protein Pla22_50630 [Rubripirellula amarantea]
MEINAEDIAIRLFVPDDQSESAAIKLTHKKNREEVIYDQTISQRENLRRALKALCERMNPHPDHIEAPALFLYDDVRIHLPESVHQGVITKQSWDYVAKRWKYFVDCHNHTISAWYDFDDLILDEPIDDDE